MQFISSLSLFFVIFFYYALPTALLCLLEYFLSSAHVQTEKPTEGKTAARI